MAINHGSMNKLPAEFMHLHPSIQQQLQAILTSARMPQAMLLIGPKHLQILQCAHYLIAMLLCEVKTACGRCSDCSRLNQAVHPDVYLVKGENESQSITIDQIRTLHSTAYQTSQRGKQRFIVLESAERMNVAAANALLKILEEPPINAVFILISETVNSVPATILSRCQKYTFTDHATQNMPGYLAIGKLYPENSIRAELFHNRHEMFGEIRGMVECKTAPCTVAESWKRYNFPDLMWWLYLMNGEFIFYQLTKHPTPLIDEAAFLSLVNSFKPLNLFRCLDKISAVIKKLNHNVTINQTLALEDILMEYSL